MLTKKNLIFIKSIIVWKWNHLVTKNYFKKKKINYYFLDLCLATFRSFVVLCYDGMVGENRLLPASTETLVQGVYVNNFFPGISRLRNSQNVGPGWVNKMAKRVFFIPATFLSTQFCPKMKFLTASVLWDFKQTKIWANWST